MRKCDGFLAEDGRFFRYEHDCLNHEFGLKIEKNINDFINSEYMPFKSANSSTATVLRKGIAAWERFKKEKCEIEKPSQHGEKL